MKNNFLLYIIAVSLLGACGSDPVEKNQSETDNSNSDVGTQADDNTNDAESDKGSDLADNGVEEVDCGSFQTEQDCHDASGGGEICSVLTATLYQAEFECYEESEYVGCGQGGSHFNSLTPARHVDGTCAIFPSTTLPASNEWTEDNKCNDLLVESGFCE